jgi:hypothetical protein
MVHFDYGFALSPTCKEAQMSDDSGSQKSPARLSGVSGSISSGDSGIMRNPLLFDQEKAEKVFDEVFDSALAFGVLKPLSILKTIPLIRVLEKLEHDLDRLAQIVEDTTGMKKHIVLKRYDRARIADDIGAHIDEDLEKSEERAGLFIKALGGAKFFKGLMTRTEMYEAVCESLWMVKDTVEHRFFAGQTTVILAKHNALGGTIETLHGIEKAISYKELFGDRVPAVLRVRMMEAVARGCRRYTREKQSEYICQYMFDSKEGVSFAELANHLPPDIMGNPFVLYCERLGIKSKAVDKDSVPPPAEAETAEPPKDDTRTAGMFFGSRPTVVVPPPVPGRPDNKPPGSM